MVFHAQQVRFCQLPLIFPPKNRRTPQRDAALVGSARFELTNAGVKVPCLTTWRRPIIQPHGAALLLKRKDRAGTGLNGLWWGA